MYFSLSGYSQVQPDLPQTREAVADSLKTATVADSVNIVPDVPGDSISAPDSQSFFSSPVQYGSRDSSLISLSDRKTYLYGAAWVTFEDKKLEADYIEFDTEKNIAYASGLKDSTGRETGLPVFTQGKEQPIEARRLSYNFKTKTGVIHEAITEQSEGFLHATQAKRYDSGIVDIKDGKFTTCDADHPHFHLAITKGRMIPNEKMVIGPSYLVLEDVPLPLGIPFGYIPNSGRRNQSGIILPTFGDEVARGFNLTNGGYYLALGDHLDARISGDIYSKGTWGLGLASNYVKRYKFSGQFNGRYYKDISGERGLDRTASTSFNIQWNHRQDPKANPTSVFNASVNLSTQSFDQKHNYYNTNRLMTNTKNSSLGWSKNWANRPYRLTANASHSQSSGADIVQVTMPSMNFSVDRMYPFRKKISVGKKKWYEDVALTYTAEMRNDIAANESQLFSDSTLRNMKNGFKHSVPINLNFKVLKNINLTPSFNYSGMVYTSSIRKRWEQDDPVENPAGRVVSDTIRGLSYAHGLAPSFSASYAPKLYITGYMLDSLSRLKAIRNTMTFSVGFRYTPDMSGLMPDYYRDLEYSYIDKNGNPVNRTEKYSIYQGYMYGTPTLPGKSGAISFSLRNMLEAKTKAQGDTVDKKVKILENLAISTSYNIFADSMHFSNIAITGSTSVFNNKLNLAFSGTLDPYSIDSEGRRYDRLTIKDGKLGRLTNFNISPSFRLQGGEGKSGRSDNSSRNSEWSDPNVPDPDKPLDANRYRDLGIALPYEYFKIPWSLGVSYDFSYSKSGINKANMVQTLRLTGDLSLTPKWKMSFNTGYDVEAKKVTHTNFTIDRDLHCWVMSLNVSPFGAYKFYGFQINVRSSMLRDLKYEKTRSHYDSQPF